MVGARVPITRTGKHTDMKLERLSTCVSAAWMIALCAVVVSAGILLTLPDDGAYWRAAMWVSIGGAWFALAAGFVLQRKFVQRVRASAMLANLDGKLRSDF
jgi:hypothetical protein